MTRIGLSSEPVPLDFNLPPEGTRLTPCYAGVSSLVGRTRSNCASTVNILAKIEFNGKGGSGPILFSPGANHYRLIGSEVDAIRIAGYRFTISSSLTVQPIIWYSIVCGCTALPRTKPSGASCSRSEPICGRRGSPFSDFHCVAKTGSCTDAQAIAGGLGDNPMGPYKIVNNSSRRRAENILFGGGCATMTPKDIEIRHNHMFKPLTWMRGQAGYVGGTDGNPVHCQESPRTEKRAARFARGQHYGEHLGRVLQVGFAILSTPKNQGGNGTISARFARSRT